MARLTPLFALCFLAACGGGDAEAPGKITPDEAKALDDAAEMIDAQRLPQADATPASLPDPGPE